jgi:hypothetical protein
VEAAEEGGEEAEGEEGVHRGHHEKTEPIEDGGKIFKYKSTASITQSWRQASFRFLMFKHCSKED